MPNVALIQDNGEPLIMPARAIRAILTLDKAPAAPGHPDAKAVAYCSFRGFSIFFLGQSANDVWAEVKSRLGNGPEVDMLEMAGRGDDGVFVLESDVTGLEGVREGDERFLRLTFTRGDGNEVFTDVAADDALQAQLTALLMEREDSAVLSMPVPEGMQVLEVPKRATAKPRRK